MKDWGVFVNEAEAWIDDAVHRARGGAEATGG